MSSDLIIGLRLSGIGLGVTFLALGLVILIMDLLVRIFPVVGSIESDDQSAEARTGDLNEKQREETAVALAVGIALLENKGGMEELDPTLGRLLEE
jgi:Na+-transporting methylmalonyl-CoA/oxaloacetate decarboxylase gamma subunit